MVITQLEGIGDPAKVVAPSGSVGKICDDAPRRPESMCTGSTSSESAGAPVTVKVELVSSCGSTRRPDPYISPRLRKREQAWHRHIDFQRPRWLHARAAELDLR